MSQTRKFTFTILRNNPAVSAWLLFAGCGAYLELVLHISVFHTADAHVLFPILFGICIGSAIACFSSLFPSKIGGRLALTCLSFLCVCCAVQCVYHGIFGSFMPLSQLTLGANALTNFKEQVVYGIFQQIVPVAALCLPIPLAWYLLRSRRVVLPRLTRKTLLPASGALAGICVLTIGALRLLDGGTVYRLLTNTSTSTESSVRHAGLTATMFEECLAQLGGSSVTLTASALDGDLEQSSSGADNVDAALDFSALADSAKHDPVSALDQYCASIAPTDKNQYTGLTKDYNLIVICAESFSPYVIDEQRTPALYKLANGGFRFHNYYCSFPNTTTNGEYALCMGLMPDMSRTKTASSFDVSRSNYLPYCMGNVFASRGYPAYAYHNYYGTFYDRNHTHPNMGYTFRAVGSGLDMPLSWPSSDKDMIDASVSEYLDSSTPFCAYYMTFSGHYQYNWDNAMSAKNRDAVCNLPYSETVQAYLACNMELEYALEDLFEQLERAGQADNTVIVLTADHYPYGLSESQYNELAGKDIDTTFEKYHNSFLCYIPNMQPVDVDTYCCDIDILPTLLNLFGVSYDSRLLAGKDILSDSTHVAMLADQSYLTDSFRYNAETGTAQSYDTRPVKDADVQAYCQYVSNVFSFSTQVLNNDYYAHVFGKSAAKQTQTYDFSDITNPFEEASALFAAENGYMQAKSRTEFGAQTSAAYGEVLRALYRMAGGTQSLSDAAVITWAQEHALISDDVSAQDTVTYGSVSRLFLRYLADRKIDVSLTETDKTQLAQIQAGYTELDDTTCLAMYWMRKHAILQDNDLGQYYSLADQVLNRAQISRCLQGISSLVQSTS